jgi:uncharacterized LabA/DUF88 family protein
MVGIYFLGGNVSDRVIVSIDYENLRFSAIDCFHRSGASHTDGNIDPGTLGDLLVERRNQPSELKQVRVYRGRPSPVQQPSASAAKLVREVGWGYDPSVKIIHRDLRYPKDYPASPAQEKGVDAALAIDFVRLAYEGAYDAGIIVSRDIDLLPALETVVELRLARVEVVAWQKASRLNSRGTQLPCCHRLTRDDYEAIRDTTDYLKDRP